MAYEGSPPNTTMPLGPTDFHVLLVLAEQDLYGYAIMKAVEQESDGAVRPEIGSLYRILGRLMTLGFVAETSVPSEAAGVHRGRPRKYYRLTPLGVEVLRAESRRLSRALELARARRLLPEGQGA